MKRIVAVSSLAVLALSGCAVTGQGADPGVAAVYGDVTITNEQVDDWADAYEEMGYAENPGDALTILLLAPVAIDWVHEAGGTFSDDLLTEQVQSWASANGETIDEPTEDQKDVVAAVRSIAYLLQDDEGYALLNDTVSDIEANATISPRYGDFTLENYTTSLTDQWETATNSVSTLGDVTYLLFMGLNGLDPLAPAPWMGTETTSSDA